MESRRNASDPHHLHDSMGCSYLCDLHGDVMSMIRCDTCSRLIDTDEHPDTHDSESDQWVCHPCRDEEMEYWRYQYETASLAERNPERYAQDMVDAGRGHLLREDEKP